MLSIILHKKPHFSPAFLLAVFPKIKKQEIFMLHIMYIYANICIFHSAHPKFLAALVLLWAVALWNSIFHNRTHLERRIITMNTMKKIATGFIAVLMAGTLAACSGTTVSSTGSLATASAAAGTSQTAQTTADTSNPFYGKTVKVGCSATFVPFESIEMDAKGNKTYVGMNIDIIKAVVEKNGGTVEFQDMPFKSLIAAIQAGQIDF